MTRVVERPVKEPVIHFALKILLGAVVLLVMATIAYWWLLYRTLEQPAYTVIAETGAYEIRQYESYLVAETTVQGTFEESGNRAFRPLARYIFGRNARDEEMAMTAPVVSAPTASEPAWTYQFVMESKYSLDTLPQPDDPSVALRTVPPRLVAARRFSGRWLEENIEAEETRLLEALRADGLNPVGTVALARYNDPFTPFFLRRNEVLVEISEAG